ncbi:MAG: hypothetical protein ACR2OH_05905 [Microthrixaceae bacterium]
MGPNVAAAVTILVLSVLALVGVSGEAGAQQGGPAIIEDVTPWVPAEGTFSVVMRVTEPLPPTAQLTWTLGQRIRADSTSLRAANEEFLSGEGTPRTLQAPRTEALDSLEVVEPSEGDAPGELRRLSFRIRPSAGDSEAILVPTSGVHPVTLELSVDGDVLWQETTFLNRLPRDPPQSPDGGVASTAVQLLVGLDSGPTLAVDGPSAIPTEEVPTVTSVQSLLSESLAVPLSVALRPNTLLGLQRSQRPGDAEFVASLPNADWSFAPQTYVRVDAAGLVAAGGSELQRQLEAGTAINSALSGRQPGPVWMLDDTVDTEAARQLASAGVTHLITSAERLGVRVDGETLEDQEAGALLAGSSVALGDVDGVSVSSYDTELTRLLVEPELEPALRAHRVVTALMATWLGAAGSDDPQLLSAAVVLTPGVGSEVVSDLAALLSGDGPLRVAAPPDAPSGPDSPVAQLRPLDPPNMAAVVRRTQRTANRIQGWRSMAGADDTLAGELDLVNDQAPQRFADAGTRADTWDSVDAALDTKVAQIQVPADRTIVLTSRSGSIPLRFRNDTGGPIRLGMRLRSPRLEFPDGAITEVVLAPGDNRVDVPVEVQAPGSSLLRLELSSPDRRLDVPDASLTVRSSSISGVGAALSVISVLVLAVWWVRTHRTRRRQESEVATTSLGSDHPADGGTGD